MFIRSKAPLRISFAGGGTDVSPYCDSFGGFALNTTINRFATIKLNIRDDDQIIIKSIDYDQVIKFDLSQKFIYDGQLDLIKCCIDYFKDNYPIKSGFEVYIQNDAPPGSGLGSSSAVCVALIGAFQEWLNLPLTPYDIAVLAFELERIKLNNPGGRQDQYAAAFGGFNFMEFYDSKTIINPLRLRSEIINELNHSLIMCYIGGSHNSGDIIQEQINNFKNKDKTSIDALHKAKEFSVEAKNLLLTGKLGKFGILIDESWKYKRQMASAISNEKIDFVYETAKKAGALGGKISGAGGGGFMFFFADIDKKYQVIKALKEIDIQILNYSFEHEGLRSWKVNI